MAGRPALGAALLALAFGALAALVAVEAPVIALDRSLAQVLAGLGGPGLVPLFQAATGLGAVTPAAVLCLVASLALWAKGRRRAVPAIWVALAGVMGTVQGVKLLLARPRPAPLEGLAVGGYSFPSGSTTIAAGVFGVIAFLMARECKTAASRWIIYLGMVGGIALVGLSRLALGAHYLSDVVAGALAGGAWALVGLAIAGPSSPRAAGRSAG